MQYWQQKLSRYLHHHKLKLQQYYCQSASNLAWFISTFSSLALSLSFWYTACICIINQVLLPLFHLLTWYIHKSSVTKLARLQYTYQKVRTLLSIFSSRTQIHIKTLWKCMCSEPYIHIKTLWTVPAYCSKNVGITTYMHVTYHMF